MNTADRKSKMVSFRLSPEEYRQLSAVCSTQGVRSISALARVSIQRFIDVDSSKSTPNGQVEDLRLRIRTLEEKLEELAKQMDRSAATNVG